jgi:hypothetical protein
MASTHGNAETPEVDSETAGAAAGALVGVPVVVVVVVAEAM